MKKNKLLKDTEGKIKWWEEQSEHWQKLSESGEFENGMKFDKDQNALVKSEIKDCEKHLKRYYEIKESLELLEKYIEKYGEI